MYSITTLGSVVGNAKRLRCSYGIPVSPDCVRPYGSDGEETSPRHYHFPELFASCICSSWICNKGQRVIPKALLRVDKRLTMGATKIQIQPGW